VRFSSRKSSKSLASKPEDDDEVEALFEIPVNDSKPDEDFRRRGRKPPKKRAAWKATPKTTSAASSFLQASKQDKSGAEGLIR